MLTGALLVGATPAAWAQQVVIRPSTADQSITTATSIANTGIDAAKSLNQASNLVVSTWDNNGVIGLWWEYKAGAGTATGGNILPVPSGLTLVLDPDVSINQVASASTWNVMLVYTGKSSTGLHVYYDMLRYDPSTNTMNPVSTATQLDTGTGEAMYPNIDAARFDNGNGTGDSRAAVIYQKNNGAGFAEIFIRTLNLNGTTPAASLSAPRRSSAIAAAGQQLIQPDIAVIDAINPVSSVREAYVTYTYLGEIPNSSPRNRNIRVYQEPYGNIASAVAFNGNTPSSGGVLFYYQPIGTTSPTIPSLQYPRIAAPQLGTPFVGGCANNFARDYALVWEQLSATATQIRARVVYQQSNVITSAPASTTLQTVNANVAGTGPAPNWNATGCFNSKPVVTYGHDLDVAVVWTMDAYACGLQYTSSPTGLNKSNEVVMRLLKATGGFNPNYTTEVSQVNSYETGNQQTAALAGRWLNGPFVFSWDDAAQSQIMYKRAAPSSNVLRPTATTQPVQPGSVSVYPVPVSAASPVLHVTSPAGEAITRVQIQDLRTSRTVADLLPETKEATAMDVDLGQWLPAKYSGVGYVVKVTTTRQTVTRRLSLTE